LTFASALLASASVQAQTASSGGPFTIGPTIGTLGAGLEAGWRASPNLGVRLDASALDFDTNRTIDGIPYKFGANLRSGGAVLDFYPFGGGFRLTGGARINGNRADVTSTPNTNVTINGDTFTPAQLGTLTGSVTYNRFAPYFGIGFAGGVTSWLVLGFDVGVLYQGTPRVNLAATGPFANNPTLQADIDRERNAIKNDINFTAFYPALTLSALFRF
jgi:hypothetical protein